MMLKAALTCLPGLFAINVLAAANTDALAVTDAAAATATPNARLNYIPGKAPQFRSVATAETIMARWLDLQPGVSCFVDLRSWLHAVRL